MPRLDGVLYNFEKAALKPKPEAKEKPARRRSGPKMRLGPSAPVLPVELSALTKAGRPPVLKKLSSELIETILNSIEDGMPQESALVLAGISRQGIDLWRKRNPLLQIKFEQAECRFEKKLLANIKGFAATDLKASAWLLERRLPRWAPVTKAELTGKDGAPLGAMTVSQQLFASVAGAKDAPGKSKRAAAEPIDVTPAKP